MRAMSFAAGKGQTQAFRSVTGPSCARRWTSLRGRIKVVVTNTHHLGAELPGLLDGHVPDEVDLQFVHESTLLGTGGGLANARHLLGEGDVVVVNGDSDFQPDLSATIADHERSGAVATMVLAPHPEPSKLGAVEIDSSGRVRRLVGRPEFPEHDGYLEAYMFSGVQVLSPAALLDMPAEGCVIRTAYRKWNDGAGILCEWLRGNGALLGCLPYSFQGGLVCRRRISLAFRIPQDERVSRALQASMKKAINGLAKRLKDAETNYYTVGKELSALNRPEFLVAFGEPSFRAFVEAQVMSYARAHQFMLVASSYPKQVAVMLEVNKAYHLGAVSEGGEHVAVGAEVGGGQSEDWAAARAGKRAERERCSDAGAHGEDGHGKGC